MPEGKITIFSAHGVSKTVESRCESRHLQVIDATCPLVSKVHVEGRRYAAQGREVILIGHAGHPEVEGTMGQVPGGVHLISTAGDVDELAGQRSRASSPTSPRRRCRSTTPAT